MIELTGNIWDCYGCPDHVVVITTNGVTDNQGRAVMGAGVALEAVKRTHGAVKVELGHKLRVYGNKVYWLDAGRMLSFPTKHHWREKSDCELIHESAIVLREIAEDHWQKTFAMPRPGCGNGGLKWEDVRPLLEILTDNVLIMHGGS